MAKNVKIPSIDRITFFNGQRLTATDLAELQRSNRELRWLHNRSLHGWGIGIGLAVTGERGARAVTVEEGYGVDCQGRELILTERQEIPVPAVVSGSGGRPAVYYLVVAYQDDSEQKVTERRPGVCLPEGTVRLSEEPSLSWRGPDQLNEGLELILAQAWIQNCQLSRPLSLAVRRYARIPDQPYVSAGETKAGETDWQILKAGGSTIGVFTHVDTTAARFHTRPQYTAHVVGDRFLPGGEGEEGTLIVSFPATVDATPNGFTFQMLLPRLGDAAIDFSFVEHITTQLAWHVVWMGIEG